jgi:DNA-binding CsgD family transcriptional regulator/tetratricopeptide (TPR) repeat protein
MSASDAPSGRAPPLVGRTVELARFSDLLTQVAGGSGLTTILSGEGGVGKTRLVGAVADRALRRGFTVAVGRAYPVETGVPYALFADALLPMLAQADPAQLAVLTRGASAELAALFPGLGGAVPPQNHRDRLSGGGDAAEVKARLLWNFAQFLGRASAKQPLLIVLENLQWADASSLELFHFVARQIPSSARVLLAGTYNETEREANPTLRTTEQSLLRLGVATVHRLEPLRQEEVTQLVREMFSVDDAALGRFPALLYAWTRGNPFFVEETLKALIARGVLYERDDRWFGWQVETLELPPTIRDAIASRLDNLTPAARSVANLAAVVGTRVSLDALRHITAVGDSELVSAVDELCATRVLEERTFSDAFPVGAGVGAVAYDFTHPLLQQVLYSALGHARASLMHATVAEALETHYGARALDHADELAFHFARAHAHTLEPKAVRYLAAAGRAALVKHANREAAGYLARALEHLDRTDPAESRERLDVLASLARARQRLGEYEQSLALWDRALRAARSIAAAAGEVAGIEYRMGLALYWSGAYSRALEQYASALDTLSGKAADPLAVQVRLARGICLQDIGRFDDAAREVREALEVAEAVGDPALLARVHRALLLMYAWSGSADLAREHGERTIELASASGQRTLLWSAHWGMAMLAGISSDARGVVDHLARAERVAEELGSPLLPLWTAELAIQYAASVGDWETGIATGERSIPLARALGQKTLLPRLLVWTGLIYLERGEPLRAKEMFDEAWESSGAGRTTDRPVDVPSIVPPHLGLAAFHLNTGNWREAVNVGEAGLAIADRAGHRIWAVQWLLPIVMEAHLRAQDFTDAAAHAQRLRRDATEFNHRLGLACATACEGLLLQYHTRDAAAAARTLESAAEQLEAIPYPYVAARVRRERARTLNGAGDRDGAVRELRRAHDVFARLGATTELAQTRDELRQLGVRPPVKAMGTGAAGLTARELEIARMVALRKANKEIGSALRISARTVSTHLSNIFAKLGVESRGELADYVREKGLLED